MIKILFYSLVISLVLISCRKEDGDLVHHSDTFPVYPSSVLEKVWETQLDSVKHVHSSVFIDDLILISEVDYLHAVSIEDGELLWTFDQKPYGLFLLANINVYHYDGKLFIFNLHNCHADAIVLSKSTGDLVDFFSISDILGLEEICMNLYMKEDQIFISTHKPNNHPGDNFNFSFFLYQYDLNSHNINLLYFDDLIYHSSYSTIPPVLNEEKTHLYFSYLDVLLDRQSVVLVEVPVTGGNAKSVLYSPLSVNGSLNTRPFVVKDGIVAAKFDLYGPYLIEVIDLKEDGKPIWHQFRQSTPNHLPTIFSHLGELYIKGADSRSDLQKRDFNSGKINWKMNFRNNSAGLIKTIDDYHLGVIFSGNGKNLSLIDLSTGSLLTTHNIVELSDIEGDSFGDFISTIRDENKMVIVTRKGKIVCLELPF